MAKTPSFKKTSKQVSAIDLLASIAVHIMLYGGSRSGKTFIILYAILVRAFKVKSRHVILREKFNHVKTSVWLDTLPKVIGLCFPNSGIKWNKTDYYITLPNGSEIWVAGLDDKERTEKILGKEYSTIFFNECSQLEWESISIALTRLAEKNELTKKAYYDENPPSKRHWSYHLFINKKNPESGEDVKNPDRYACMLMNPTDNRDNLDEGYIEGILEDLPEHKRMRFLLGEFLDEDDRFLFDSKRIQEILSEGPSKTHKLTNNRLLEYPILNAHVGGLEIYRMPVNGKQYVIGADVAEGLESGDNSAFCILDENLNQVASWCGDIDPDLLGKMLVETAKLYNDALLVPEINSIGYATLAAIRNENYYRLYLRKEEETQAQKISQRQGWRTTRKNKLQMIYEFHAAFRDGDIDILDHALLKEMDTICLEEDGDIIINGKDRVAAACIALQGHKQLWGNDYTIDFVDKHKKKPKTLMEKHEQDEHTEWKEELGFR